MKQLVTVLLIVMLCTRIRSVKPKNPPARKAETRQDRRCNRATREKVEIEFTHLVGIPVNMRKLEPNTKPSIEMYYTLSSLVRQLEGAGVWASSKNHAPAPPLTSVKAGRYEQIQLHYVCTPSSKLTIRTGT